MKSINYVPLEGNSDSLFERLTSFIEQFDSNWKYQIKGASEEKIDKYFDMAIRKGSTYKIPDEYIVYLVKMGECDDGLLENFTKGSTNIDILIDYYKDRREFVDGYDEVPLNHFVIGHSLEAETDIYLKYSSNVNYEINRTVSSNLEFEEDNWFSSSFEKLLFQSILFKYIGETKKYRKECVVPINSLKNKGKLNSIEVMKRIDYVCKKYRMSKIWISDNYNYLAYSNEGIIYLKLDFNLYGDVWSDNEQFANKLINSVIQSGV